MQFVCRDRRNVSQSVADAGLRSLDFTARALRGNLDGRRKVPKALWSSGALKSPVRASKGGLVGAKI